MHQVQAVVSESSLRRYVIGKFVSFAEAALPTAIPALAMLTNLKINGCSPMEAYSHGRIGIFQCPGARCREPHNGV
jgi:hypothetical protein